MGEMIIREMLDIEVSPEDRKLADQARGYLDYLASKGITAILIMGREADEPGTVKTTIKMGRAITPEGIVTLTTAYNLHAADVLRRMSDEGQA